jgi:hypothetical protein
MRLLPLAVLLVACAPSYDLSVRLDRDTVPVGEDVTITLSGVIDAPANASAYLHVFVQDPGASLDVPEVTFETLGATPSGSASLLDGRDAADNASADVLLELYDPNQDIRARWRMTCGTPGEWEVVGAVRLQGAGGAPLTGGQRSMRSAMLTCE